MSTLDKLGFSAGQVVQEFGYDDDVDDDFRFQVEDCVGAELEDEDYAQVADAALLWHRDDEWGQDLVDLLVDALTNLADGGFIVLCTPRAGQTGYVEPSEVGDAVTTAGLTLSGNAPVGATWTANRLVAGRGPRSGKGSRHD